MQVDEFLKTVVTTDAGWFCLARRIESDWAESFYRWPDDLDKILAEAAIVREIGDVYFSPHLFAEKRSLKSLVLPSRTLQADLDEAEVASFPVLPTVLVETSPLRHQGYWIVDKALDVQELESYTRRIAYGIPNCDKTGWPAGKKLRMPNTHNYKYTAKHLVEIRGLSLQSLPMEVFNTFPELEVSLAKAEQDVEWVEDDPEPLNVRVIDLLNSVKPHLPARVISQYTKPARDRSAALWAFVTECLRAGLTREQTFFLARENRNNKFAERTARGDVDLRKDILRAEQYVNSRQVDLKAVVMDIRHRGNNEPAAVRANKVVTFVLAQMRQQGEFVHTKDGFLWYLRTNTGRPIHISTHSAWLNAYLDNTFGLNASENLQKFVCHALAAYVRALPASDDLQMLSYYEPKTNKLLLHTGGRDVLHVSTDRIEVHHNGYGGIVFAWPTNNEPFDLGKPTDEPWYELLFRMHSNCVNLTTDESVCLLRACVLFLLFRKLAATRPILTLLGQPGSGKTTIAHKLYLLIYGRFKSLSGISNKDDFDLLSSKSPMIVYDNVDTYEAWLPDRLAMSTSDTVIERRLLYSDADIISLYRRAMVTITAHNPKFTREDVMDRMLVLLFSRLPRHDNEHVMLEALSNQRDRLMASLVQDVQRVLATPKPAANDCPPFRISDFSWIGVWVSRAISPEMEQLFRSAMAKQVTGQRSANLEHDQLLVSAIARFVEKQTEPEYYKCDKLLAMLTDCAPDARVFSGSFKNPARLQQKLWTLHDSLKQMFDVTWKYDDASGNTTRLWRLAPKRKE